MPTNDMQWSWFMSVCDSGRWMLTEGTASVDITPARLSAVLYFSPDSPEYMRLTWKTGEGGQCKVLGYADGDEAPTLTLVGSVAKQLGKDGKVIAVVATDGMTTLGLARR